MSNEAYTPDLYSTFKEVQEFRDLLQNTMNELDKNNYGNVKKYLETNIILATKLEAKLDTMYSHAKYEVWYVDTSINTNKE
jgi:hypothetical protein